MALSCIQTIQPLLWAWRPTSSIYLLYRIVDSQRTQTEYSYFIHSIEQPAATEHRMSATKSFLADQLNNEPWLDMTCYPTIFDIMSLKCFLSQRLPNEIIDMIFDLSEYWPHSSRSLPSPIIAKGKLQESLQQAPVHWLEHRDSQASHLPSLIAAGEEPFILRSPLLGFPPTNVLQSPTLLVPRTRHPVRMIIFEIRYYRLFAINPKCRRPQIVRTSSARLEIGIKKPTHTTANSARFNLEPEAWLKDHVCGSSLRLRRICDLVYTSWQSKRTSYDQVHTKIDLYMDHKELADGMIGQKAVIWKSDDSGNYLDDGWNLSSPTLQHISEADKAHVKDYVHTLAKEDRREEASFLKQVEVGDSLVVWVKGRDGPTVSMIEGARMHVFWAAS